MGIIDAITGPTIKQGDIPGVDVTAVGTGSAFARGLARDLSGAADTAIEKAQVIVERAKDSLEEPLKALERIASKAIPASLAACASLQYTGGQGSFTNFFHPVTFNNKYFLTDGDRTAYIGKPLHEVRQLSTLTGFVQCENVSFSVGLSSGAGPTLEEQQIIKQYLEAGCFIE